MSDVGSNGFQDTRLRPGKLRAWVPKRWRVEYERIVAYSACGWSNVMIAKEVGYTREHVSTILNMDEAENIRQILLSKMRDKSTNTIPEQIEKISQGLERIAVKTVERLTELLDDDDKFKSTPFAIIDRGMEVLKGRSHLRTAAASNGTNIEKAVIITGSAAANLTEGMEKADQARLMHVASAEVVEK